MRSEESLLNTAGEGVVMRTVLLLIVCACLLFAVGCTTTANGEKPKIHCPACGTDLDAIMHKHF